MLKGVKRRDHVIKKLCSDLKERSLSQQTIGFIRGKQKYLSYTVLIQESHYDLA
jgi:hypothetical protein